MKVLVTGGAGFIGSHLCKRLIQNGNDVVTIDSLSNGSESNLKSILDNPHFEFIRMNIRDTYRLKNIFTSHKFEMVYHLAANADVYKGIDDSNLDVENTFLTTLNILEMMHEVNVNKLFFASSSTVYGRSDEPISEDSPLLRPISHYGAAKLASEAFVSSYSNLYDIKTWVARFCNVVGPNMTHGVIPDFIKKLKSNPRELRIYGDGKQLKPYIFIDDLLDGITSIIQHANDMYNAYLIGVDSCISVSEIAQIVMDEVGIHIPVVYEKEYIGAKGDVSIYKYNINKLRELGWEPRYTAKESVKLAANLNNFK